MLRGRATGRSLEEIAQEHRLTGERVRQLILRAEGHLVAAGDAMIPGWRQRLVPLRSAPAVPTSVFAETLPSQDKTLIEIFSGAVGFEPARAWSTRLDGWWTADQGALDDLLYTIANEAPMRDCDLQARAATLGATNIPIEPLFAHEGSPLIQDGDGNWLRRRFRVRDSAYLYLLERGETCLMEDLVAPTGISNPHSLREALRRDTRFRKIRPEGAWALTEWTHISVPQYANAVEAMVDVLTTLGPLSKEVLFARVTERYPVSSWRLRQCLVSDEIGKNPDGLIDLVRRGAAPIEDREPAQPSTMTCDADSNVFGVRLTVDNDLMRGSSILVNPWITWRLGLRQAPMSRVFDTGGNFGPLTVRRVTSGAQISSLRQHARAQLMSIGCELIVLLRVDDLTARIVHACSREHITQLKLRR